MLPNKYENQYQIIYKPTLDMELRQVFQFVDQGMMTMGQPSGLSPEGAMNNTELEIGGHDWSVELKRLKSQYQNAYSVSYVQSLKNMLGTKYSSGNVGIELVRN